MASVRFQNDANVTIDKQWKDEATHLDDSLTHLDDSLTHLDDSFTEEGLLSPSESADSVLGHFGNEHKQDDNHHEGRRRSSLARLWGALPPAILPNFAPNDDEQPPTESSALLPPQTSRLDPKPSGRRRSSLIQKSRGKWKLLKQKVTGGEFLIETPSMSCEERDREMSQRREEAEKAIRDGMDFTLTQCLYAIFIYVLVSVLAFSFIFDKWTIIDSMYFACVTFTTIGYGDLYPETRAARIFTCFFALSGIVCLGIALGIVGDKIIAAHDTACEQATKLSKERVVGLFLMKSEGRRSSIIKNQQGELKLLEDEKCDTEVPKMEDKRVSGLVRQFSLVLLVLIIFAMAVHSDPGIGAEESFYYALITGTTVGLGDLTPQTQRGRLIATIFIPLAVGATGHWLAEIASWIIERRQAKFRKQLISRDLSLEDIENMDSDGDGGVTRAEFLEFMLVSMNKVDQDLLDELKFLFNHLDTDGTGILSKGDLIETARRRLQGTRRKLELSAYKRKLLEQGISSTVGSAV